MQETGIRELSPTDEDVEVALSDESAFGPPSPSDEVALEFLRWRVDEQLRTVQTADDRARVTVGFALVITTALLGAGGVVARQIDPTFSSRDDYVIAVALAGLMVLGGYTFLSIVISFHKTFFSQRELRFGPLPTEVVLWTAGQSAMVKGRPRRTQPEGVSAEDISFWLTRWMQRSIAHNEAIVLRKIGEVRTATGLLVPLVLVTAIVVLAAGAFSLGDGTEAETRPETEAVATGTVDPTGAATADATAGEGD